MGPLEIHQVHRTLAALQLLHRQRFEVGRDAHLQQVRVWMRYSDALNC